MLAAPVSLIALSDTSSDNWPRLLRWPRWFFDALTDAHTRLLSIPVGVALVAAWADSVLSVFGVHVWSWVRIRLPFDLAAFAKPTTGLLALGFALYATGRVGWRERERAFRKQAPIFELLDPESHDFVGDISSTWWRVLIVNRGMPANLTVKLTGTNPKVTMRMPEGTLHRAGDNPPNGYTFQDVFNFAHDERQWYDLVSVWQTWKAVYEEAPSTAKEPTVSGPAVPPSVHAMPTQTTAKEFIYFVHIIEVQNYRERVTLDGTYTFSVTAYSGDFRWSRDYHVEADPKTGRLNVTALGQTLALARSK